MSDNLEYCFKCDEPTGCAGRADDSHYNEDGEGPFCWGCWCEDENPRLHEQIDHLKAELETANTHIGWIKDTRVRLNKSIKLRDNAFDALIDMSEKKENELKADITTANAENKRLRELLGKAWNVVDDLDTQCASDVATGCWPAKLGYSEADVRRINKEIESFMENKP